MELADLSKPGEKKKLIGAAVLGLVAIIFLWWTFIGFGSSKPTPSPSPSRVGQRTAPAPGSRQAPAPEQVATNYNDLQGVIIPAALTGVPEARRNIFAFYEKTVVVPVASATPTPTPTPPPPVLVASVSPSNVYAKTAEFTLEVSGDKFTPEMRIFVDGRELPSKYKGPQQMSAQIPASLIASAGLRQIVVRTPDNRAYSNQVGLSVAPPPTPNYTYVGILGTKHYVGDTALLQDKNNKEILSVQRGDVLSGRFRVASISEKEIVFLDTNLKIRHSLNMTEGERLPGSPQSRPTPRVDAEDDEP
ncbi:MAG: hypothetical protein DMF69_05120 [Acidobacteria bacterium]|nr:MAG: hypothetical protein DMF69_05120 [Acidobacteriota bacterium]